jgi:hypothetical protein
MAGVSRHPSLAFGRPTRRWGVIAMSALVGAGISMGMVSAAPRAVIAVEGPAAAIEGKFVDVALIERGPGEWPDLLTVDAEVEPSPVAWLTLYRRDGGWSKLAEGPITHGIGSEAVSGSWLVDLGGTRLALLTTSGAEPLTNVVLLDVDGGRGLDAIRAGEPIALDMNVSSAGSADTTGTGRVDLVVAGSPDADPYGECANLTLRTLAGDDFRPLVSFDSPHLRIGGATFGEWDGRAGADLLAHFYATCPADPDASPEHDLRAIRLADGSTIVDLAGSDRETYEWGSTPLRIDVDGDGRDEAVVRGEDRLDVLDPTDGWNPLMIASGDPVPIHARPAPVATGGSPGALFDWVGAIVGDASLEVGTTRVERVGGTLRVVDVNQHPIELMAVESEILWSRLRDTSLSQQPMPAWPIDVDGDDCPELVTLRVRLSCDGAAEPVAASSWLQTGLLGEYGPPGERRVLTTVGVDWYPYLGANQIPSPSAAWPTGAWRPGWSTWFRLADLPSEVVSRGSDATVPSPTVDVLASADGRIQLHGPPGSRLLVRSVVLPAPGSVMTFAVRDRQTFLATEPTEGEFVTMFDVPAPAGDTAVADTGSVDFEIRAIVSDVNGLPAESWGVMVATLDSVGAVSDPVSATVVWDVVAPTVTAETPLVTAPWPFEGSIHGTSEAGAQVRTGGGPPVVVGSDGSFDLGVQLAPWPQTIELTSTDPSGNVGTAEVSVMGGVDLRQFPWPAIGTVLIIVAVFASSLRGRRGVQQIATIEVADGEHLPVIEELSAGRIPPRD